MTILGRKKNTTEIDYRMELLLNLRGFKGRIQQIDRNRAKYPVEIGYTLICNITRNVSEWPIKSPDPDNEGEYLAIHYADFSEPEKARANATELIKAYQEALINRSLEIEEKPVEEPIPGNLPRTRAKGPRVMDPDQAAEEAKAKREAQRKEAEAKYLQAQAQAPADPEEVQDNEIIFTPEESEALEILTAQDQAGDIQEEQGSGADSEEVEDLPADPEGEVRDQEAQEAQEENPEIEYQNHEWEDVEKEEVQEIRTKNKEEFERSTLDTLNKSTWTPLFSFTGPKSREVDLSELVEAPEPENEIFINKNSNGYSWRITARAASMEEAVENAIRANERLNKSLIPKTE